MPRLEKEFHETRAELETECKARALVLQAQQLLMSRSNGPLRRG